MPVERVAANPCVPCLHPDHTPPSMMVYPPGEYKHTCAGCGKTSYFYVSGVYC